MKAKSRLRNRLGLIAACFAIAAPLVPSHDVAHAGTGLNTWHWDGPNITLSSSSYQYSNMTGFWQAIVNSDQCPIAVDGIYGNLTTWYTAVLQNHIFNSNNGGVMTPGMLELFHEVESDVYGRRLSDSLYTDGYGTHWYGYYSGFEADKTALGWNPISSQWLFSQYPVSAPWALVAATPSRTIGSVAACS
jgi:hypothetical protein